MDSDREIAKVQPLAWAAGVILVTGLFSLDELRYALFGKTTQATVNQTRLALVPRYPGDRAEKLVVEYSFHDGAGMRNEKDYLPTDRPPPIGGTIVVQYLAGEPDASRVAGNRNVGALVIFIGSLILTTLFTVKLAREANASPKRRR